MHKHELIERLMAFAAPIADGEEDRIQWKGQRDFVAYFIHYLQKLDIPSDAKYDFWDITPYLPELAVDAFEQFRTNDDLLTRTMRAIYEERTGHEVPNITDLGASDVLTQASAVQTTLGFMLKDVTGLERVEQHIDAYCNAQKYVLQQTFDKFLRRVYRQGLYALINASELRGMQGEFGETELRTYTMAGRLLFTFARRIDKSKDGYYEEGDRVICNERSVSFVAEEDDPLCLSSGIQSVYADFRTALDMIEDVIRLWPEGAEARAQLYKENATVGFGL